jgi:hypothetical protein
VSGEGAKMESAIRNDVDQFAGRRSRATLAPQSKYPNIQRGERLRTSQRQRLSARRGCPWGHCCLAASRLARRSDLMP